MSLLIKTEYTSRDVIGQYMYLYCMHIWLNGQRWMKGYLSRPKTACCYMLMCPQLLGDRIARPTYPPFPKLQQQIVSYPSDIIFSLIIRQSDIYHHKITLYTCISNSCFKNIYLYKDTTNTYLLKKKINN